MHRKAIFLAVGLVLVFLVVLAGRLPYVASTASENREASPAPTFLPQAEVPQVVLPTMPPARLPLPTATRPVPPTFTSVPAGVQPTVPSPPTVSYATLPPNTVFHTVQTGETLVQIAQIYGVSIERIISINNLPPSGAINTGQVLVLPVAQAPTVTPVSADALTTINGIPLDSYLIMPEAVQQHVLQIYAAGLAQERNPQALSIIGDSTAEKLNFLTAFDYGPYDLGNYGYLQAVITHYHGSFARDRQAVRVGLNTGLVFTDDWAEPTVCNEHESMIDCEFRLQNPSIVLIRIGSNDGKPEVYDQNIRRMVAYAIEHGVVPILGTKADTYLDPDNANNNLLRQIARDYNVPLWDFQLVAQTLPNNGLLPDNVHPTLFPEYDYTMPEAFRRGHGVQNLTALIVLDQVWQLLSEKSAQ